MQLSKTKTSILSEKEIVSLIVKRDVRGIDALYDQYGKYIYGLIFQVIKTEGVAEIVLQDTFLKVWNKIDKYSLQKGRFLTWLISIARNSAIDMTRSKNYKQSMKLISLNNVSISSEKTISGVNIESMDMRDIVAKLDPKYKELIELVYFKGFTQTEASDELGLPLGTVKSRIRKALSDLRYVFDV